MDVLNSLNGLSSVLDLVSTTYNGLVDAYNGITGLLNLSS